MRTVDGYPFFHAPTMPRVKVVPGREAHQFIYPRARQLQDKLSLRGDHCEQLPVDSEGVGAEAPSATIHDLPVIDECLDNSRKALLVLRSFPICKCCRSLPLTIFRRRGHRACSSKRYIAVSIINLREVNFHS